MLAHNKALAAQLCNELRISSLITLLILHLLLRLLPTGGLRSGQRHLHRQDGVDQRGDRHAAPLGDAVIV